jgi:hypothetical protein
MPESASEIHRRSADALRMPPVQERASFPFDGRRPAAHPEDVWQDNLARVVEHLHSGQR